MNQRERAVNEVRKLRFAIDMAAVIELEEVLGEAQNGPPQGAADGTITAAEWSTLWQAARALRSFISATRTIAPGVPV